jgi:hypothetical protein
MWCIHGNSSLTLMDSMEANHEFQKESVSWKAARTTIYIIHYEQRL